MKPWIFRCLPIFSSITLVVIILIAFRHPYECSTHQENPHSVHSKLSSKNDPCPTIPRLSITQTLFVAYSLILHSQSVLFVAQIIWALWWITKNARAVRAKRADDIIDEKMRLKFQDNQSSSTPASYSEDEKTLYSPQEYEEIDEKLLSLEDRIIHAIILPNYMEDIGTLRETLDVLASHAKAKRQYEVYLAMEEKEAHVFTKARLLLNDFEDSFLDIKYTIHPYGTPGEAAGKSSNVSFAAKKVFSSHQNDAHNVIITVMDEIRKTHLEHAMTTSSKTIYHCPIIFDRNANKSPALVRAADLVWVWGSIAGLIPGNPISIPVSVYSLPMTLAEAVGGWDADSGAIGEDMHMLLKCFFKTSGTVVTRPVFSAVSQCNVSGDSSAKPGRKSCISLGMDFKTMHARYKQGLRHMWGTLDSGYFIRETIKARRILGLRHITLAYMLWQAHFLIQHFFIVLVFSTAISIFRPSANIHPYLKWTFDFTATMRPIGLILFNVAFVFHDRLHDICARARSNDMDAAGLLCPVERRKWYSFEQLSERVVLPIVGVAYGVLPSFMAQLQHLWTEDIVYVVALKPKVEGKEGKFKGGFDAV